MQISKKLEGADFKYDNTAFKFQHQKYPNQALLVPNLGIFLFSSNFAIRQIQGRWFQIWQYRFQIAVQKMLKYGIFGTQLKHFCFFAKLRM